MKGRSMSSTKVVERNLTATNGGKYKSSTSNTLRSVELMLGRLQVCRMPRRSKVELAAKREYRLRRGCKTSN